MTDNTDDMLKNHVRSIADTLEDPPLVREDTEEELPEDTLKLADSHYPGETHITGYDRKVPADFMISDKRSADGNLRYIDTDDADIWKDDATGEVWEGWGEEYWWSEDGDLILGKNAEAFEARAMSAMDYLSDVLDIEYIVNADAEYLGARVLVAYGGPSIWINTRTSTVEGHWWMDTARASFNDEIGLDEALSELWGCR